MYILSRHTRSYLSSSSPRFLSKCSFWGTLLVIIIIISIVQTDPYLNEFFCLHSCLHLSARKLWKWSTRLGWGRIICLYWQSGRWSTRLGWDGGRIIGLTMMFIRRHQENMRNELLKFSNQSSANRDESRIAFWSWCLMNVWVVSDYAPNLFLFSVGLFLRWWKLGSCSFCVTPQIFSRGFVCLSNRKMRATQVLPFLPLLVTCQACTLHITIENIMTKWWNVCSGGQVDQSTGPCSVQKF